MLGEYKEYQVPDYGVATTRALYIPMRDGVKIALDVLLPARLTEGERIPTILLQTRYWRAFEFQAGGSWLDWARSEPFRFFVSHGYAVVTNGN